MQQMLTHLYFYTLLEKLQSCHYSPSQLVVLITAIDKVVVILVLKNSSNDMWYFSYRNCMDMIQQAVQKN